MAYNFPNSPSNGDTVTVNGVVYTYISADNAWKTGTGLSPAILSDGSTPTLGSGITAAEVRTLIGSVDLSSVASDIIPDGDGTRDLGSSSAKFKDLHLSGNTLHLGAQTLEADASSIILSQLKIGSGSNQVTLSGGTGGTLETGGSAIFSGVFADLTSKPTTLAGYGITDGATTSYVTTQITNLVDSAPSTLNTLNELAAALNDDANFSTTITTSLATKAPLDSPTLTGTPAAPTASSGTNTTQIATTAFVQANKFSGAFSALTGKPTTIAGYGITDAFDGSFTSLSSKPTTIAGYGITDTFFDGAYTSLTSVPTTIAHKNADIDIGSNDFITTGKVLFANMYSALSDLPSATTYHGMFAHVHATGGAYFAHAGNWVELANKSYVNSQITAVVDSAPGALDTLNELAAALNDDASFSTTVTNSIATKAPLANPTFTGTPAAPTAASGTNTTQLATTAFVQAAVAGGGGGGGASVTTSDSAPSSPSDGDLWYNTNLGGLFVYYQDANSSQWVEVVGKTGATGATGAAGGATISVSDAAPSSPTAGQLWWNSTANKLYIYYTDADSSQWVQATTPGAAGSTGAAGADGAAVGRNRFINGNFDVWQRGTSFSASAYAADRWKNGYGGGNATVFSQQSFTLGQTDVPNNPEFYSRLVTTSANSAGSYATLNQKIEDVRTFSGQTVTISFWAKADSVKNIAIEPYQNFGTGGSPSSSVLVTPQKFALSTAWTKYTKTFTIPSITGKTIGTDANDFLQIAFWLEAGSTFNSRTDTLGNQNGTFEFAQLQIEKGSSATDFEHKSIGETTRECNRYFVGGTGNSLHIGAGGYATGSGQTARAYTNATFPARMRVNPTVSITVTQKSNSIASVGYVAVNPSSGLFKGTTSSSGVPGTVWWRGTVELDAEL